MAVADDMCIRQPRRFLSRSQSIERQQNGKRSHTDADMNIAVVGHSGVGKSALIVRYITKRFIGDYSDHESVCTYHAVIDGKPAKLNIMDTRGQEEDDASRDELTCWADGFLLVFSMTDRRSYDRLATFLDHFAVLRPTNGRRPPLVLVANKADLSDRRAVSAAEASGLADELRCPYAETSARDDYERVAEAFAALYRETRTHMKNEKIRRLAHRGALSRISQLRVTLRNLTESRGRTYTF